MEERLADVTLAGPVATVTLRRPHVRNAFNAALIERLREIFLELDTASDVRVVVLEGEGKSFCGGADINWMRGSLELTAAEKVVDALAMSDMYRAIDTCSKPVVARVHGAALGGGSGMCAVADIAIASDDALFGFTEVKLGIIPATIGPFAIAKIGPSHARALFLTGERFGAERALAIGLIHDIVPPAELDARVARVVSELLASAPTAVTAAKRVVSALRETDYAGSRELMAQAIAEQRTSPEGQEGLRAFLERRPAVWTLR